MKTPADNLFKRPMRMFCALTVLTLIAVSAIGFDVCLRSRFQDAVAAKHIQGLGISWTALTPAGTVPRNPEATHPGVNLRYAPGLPYPLPPMGSFLKSPGNAVENMKP